MRARCSRWSRPVKVRELEPSARVTLNDGNSIPILGLGVFASQEGSICERAVEAALACGYRHIDTASDYRNEASVGRVIATSGLPREELFITTKLWPGADATAVPAQFQASLDKLQTDYVDLYLIHWPIGCYQEAWRILVELRAKGRCRSIGVSNYTIRRFQNDFLPRESVLPAVNQIELHAFNQQSALVTFCTARGIAVAAYSPLSRAEKLEHPVLVKLAAAVGKSPAQVLIRFLLQRGIVAVPKSSSPARIRENFDVFDFSLDEAQMKVLAGLSDETYFSLRWRPSGYY